MTTSYYPKHYCGIVGVYGTFEAASDVYYGLYALQHRGQESAGIVSTNGEGFFEHKGVGLVRDVFAGDVLQTLGGIVAIGHNRYSTTGGTGLKNAQPLCIECRHGRLALAHNGNLTNTTRLRSELEASGAMFLTTTDSEIMLHLLARSEKPLEEAVHEMMEKVEGAYSMVILTKKSLIAVRDPHGFRPLSLGKLGKAWVVASETCAFDIIMAKFERDLEPGEIVVIDAKGIRSLKSESVSAPKPAFCAFEYIYFARPDSTLLGRSVYNARIAMGHELANEYPIEADIVVPIPDSGNLAAMGYAQKLGIPLEPCWIRNHYVGRSFILPKQGDRDKITELKLSLIPERVRGKRVVVVDDSIVRGTTSGNRVKKIREAGAKEVHMLVSCPPHKHPCFYGIDFPDPKQLIANRLTVPQILDSLRLDSLGYLSEAGLIRAIGHAGLCLACYNGRYPVIPEMTFAR